MLNSGYKNSNFKRHFSIFTIKYTDNFLLEKKQAKKKEKKRKEKTENGTNQIKNKNRLKITTDECRQNCQYFQRSKKGTGKRKKLPKLYKLPKGREKQLR